MTQVKTKTTSKPKPKRRKPTQAVDFSVWAVNGGPLSDEVVTKLEEGFERLLFELFNEGHRLLSQTNRG